MMLQRVARVGCWDTTSRRNILSAVRGAVRSFSSGGGGGGGGSSSGSSRNGMNGSSGDDDGEDNLHPTWR